MAERTSAGILLYRRGSNPDAPLEVLLAHPGGPYFAKRDLGDWTIPKGEPDGRHEPLDAVARREFEEETGTAIDPTVPAIELGSIVQKGGKVVHAWAVEGDLDPATAHSNEFEIEWPPRSGKRQRIPGDRSGRVVRPDRGAPADQADPGAADRSARGSPGEPLTSSWRGGTRDADHRRVGAGRHERAALRGHDVEQEQVLAGRGRRHEVEHGVDLDAGLEADRQLGADTLVGGIGRQGGSE